MSFLINAFNVVLYQPLFNALVFLYTYLPGSDFGLAIIVLTILTKLVVYPLNSQTIKSQKALTEIQPEVKEIQEKYKGDKEKQAQEMMSLYKERKVSPLSGCLPVLIQFPIIIALYRVFWGGLDPERLSLLYSFIPNPGAINSMFLGFLDLANPSAYLAVIVGIFQFIQLKMISAKRKKSLKKKKDFTEQFQKQTQYFMPLFIVVILWNLPSALALYFLTTTVFTIVQQYIITKKT